MEVSLNLKKLHFKKEIKLQGNLHNKKSKKISALKNVYINIDCKRNAFCFCRAESISFSI